MIDFDVLEPLPEEPLKPPLLPIALLDVSKSSLLKNATVTSRFRDGHATTSHRDANSRGSGRQVPSSEHATDFGPFTGEPSLQLREKMSPKLLLSLSEGGAILARGTPSVTAALLSDAIKVMGPSAGLTAFFLTSPTPRDEMIGSSGGHVTSFVQFGAPASEVRPATHLAHAVAPRDTSPE
jgi:hypothetical protein